MQPTCGVARYFPEARQAEGRQQAGNSSARQAAGRTARPCCREQGHGAGERQVVCGAMLLAGVLWCAARQVQQVCQAYARRICGRQGAAGGEAAGKWWSAVGQVATQPPPAQLEGRAGSPETLAGPMPPCVISFPSRTCHHLLPYRYSSLNGIICHHNVGSQQWHRECYSVTGLER